MFQDFLILLSSHVFKNLFSDLFSSVGIIWTATFYSGLVLHQYRFDGPSQLRPLSIAKPVRKQGNAEKMKKQNIV